MGFRYATGSACGLALAAAVAAQAPPRPQPAQPQPAQPRPVNPYAYPTPIYRMNDVGRALNLTPDQATRLNALTEQTQAQFRNDYAALGTAAAADRAARQRELNRQYSTAWDAAARDVFSDTQRNRYRQLGYQYAGFDALYNPDVRTRLGLTADQLKALDDQAAWSDRQLQELSRLSDRAKAGQAYRDYWAQRQERLNSYLTPAQQKAWREMTGDPYAFQPPLPPR